MNTTTIQLALTISAVSAMLFIASLGAAMASNANPRSATDAQGDLEEIDLADFDIMAFGFSGDTPYIQVYGLAGRTVEIEGLEDSEGHEGHAGEKVLAYVIDTNSGVWALDIHSFDHDADEANQNQWHGQHVIVKSKDCVFVDNVESKAKMAGARAFFEETTGVDTINGAATMVLEIIVDPHTDPDADCHAKVLHVFDDTDGIEPVSRASKDHP